jgi:hypothetical protein
VGKKSKKAKKNKLPKRIAGVKVPKELREAGGMLFKVARDPHAREVALAAVTAALAARKDNRKAARKAVLETGEAADKAVKATSWLGPALTAAAVEAGRLLLDAYEGGKSKEGEKAGNGASGEAEPAKNLHRKEEPASGSTH